VPTRTVHTIIAVASCGRDGCDTGGLHTPNISDEGRSDVLAQVLTQVLHELGNGRAVANARRDVERERFFDERLALLAGRLPTPATASRPAA
jgi:hypothetical protein